MAKRKTKQDIIDAQAKSLAKAKKELRSILHLLDLNCRECCGNSVTEAKRCGMKGRCMLYPYNPRFIEENRERVDKM